MNPDQIGQFAELFKGRGDAWGTGKGAVIRGSLSESHYQSHLRGEAPGLGIFPLLDDGTVNFAAVDLDEPDFAAAQEIKSLLPKPAYVEESRSGNFHVWTFFDEPIEAWIPRGIMKMACEGAGKPNAEIFPKQDRLLPGMVGNYINLPYHGGERVIVGSDRQPIPINLFLAWSLRSQAEVWRGRARRLNLQPRAVQSGRDQGTAANLHKCAVKIIQESNDGSNPIQSGHRHIVLFNLAKMLLDYREMDDEEAWMYLSDVNDASPDSLDRRELSRIFNNARRGGFTSTGCDNPVMAPYVHPDCRIAHGHREG